MALMLAQLNDLRPSLESLGWFAPEIAWVGVLCLLMIAPLIVGRRPKPTATLALAGLIVVGFFTYRVGAALQGGAISSVGPDLAARSMISDGILIADNLSVFFKFVLLLFIGGVVWLWWVGQADDEENAPEFFVLLIGSALGMAMMASTLNLLMIIVAIEFASLPSYAIVGFNKKNRLAAEASLKYMIFGAVSAATMLYGVSLLYGYFGTFDITMIASGLAEAFATPADKLIVGMGLFCFFAGVAFKISAVPFHFWCPDAFQGARTEVTAWLSVASKAAGLLLLLRIAYAIGAITTGPGAEVPLQAMAWTIAIIAIITCTVGNLVAYWQKSVKRLLAYSSISHAGYMLMAASVFVAPEEVRGFAAISAVLMYVVVYMFMNLGAFGVTAMIAWRNGGDDSLERFNGLIRRAPMLALPMLFCLISLVGLPPFAGFWAKFYLLGALGVTKGTLQWTLIIVAVINTLISLWYYMRIVVAMMIKPSDEPELDAPPSGVMLVNLCGAMLVLLMIFAGPLMTRTDAYARNLWLPGADANVAAAPAVSDELATTVQP